MTIINPNSQNISKEELETRYWMNQTPLPPTPDDIYNIKFLDKVIKVKKAKDYPFGSVAGFTQEQDVMEQFFYPHIDKESVFIDVGAMWGTYSLRALAIGAQVIAFEPDPRYIKGLRDNIALNHFEERFILYEGALGQENAFIAFDDLEDIPLAILDSFINYRPTYIKIDVEGMESLVVDGAVKILEAYHPKILIENHGYRGFNITSEISERYMSRLRRMETILLSLQYKIDMGPEYGRVYFTFCH